MPPATEAVADTAFTIDRASHTIRMIRRFAAAREQVFAAWTDPRQVACWWDPAGDPLEQCDIDLRVGGRFTFVSRSHRDMPFSGTYSEIAPPERLVFEAMGSIGRVALADAEGGTVMTVEIASATDGQLEQFVAMGVHTGTSRTLDNLVDYLGG